MRSLALSLFLPLFLVGLAVGCSGTTTREVWIEDFEVEERSDLLITFRLHGRWHNGCGEVSGFSTRLEGDRYSVRMFGEQPTHAVCTDNMKPISGLWGARVPSPRGAAS